jgi:hypothetical protein
VVEGGKEGEGKVSLPILIFRRSFRVQPWCPTSHERTGLEKATTFSNPGDALVCSWGRDRTRERQAGITGGTHLSPDSLVKLGVHSDVLGSHGLGGEGDDGLDGPRSWRREARKKGGVSFELKRKRDQTGRETYLAS